MKSSAPPVTLLLSICILLLSATTVHASDNEKSLKKISTNDNYNYLNANNLMMWIGNNGSTAYNPNSGAGGMYWPISAVGSQFYSAKSVVFEDGIVWAGYIGGQLSAGGSMYRQGLQAGPILSNGTAADPNNPKYKIYKIQKNYIDLKTANPVLYQQLADDYTNWPIEDGAPAEAGPDGTLLPHFLGDQQLWFVSNDLDSSRTKFFLGCLPIGMELQTTIFGYSDPNPLAQTIFKKYILINKGRNRIDSMFIGQFSDPDLGDASDDLIGCDTTLSLNYCYNAKPIDAIYGGKVPACGYVFLQTPIVKGNSTDTARWNFGLKAGYKNTPLYSMIPIFKDSYSDTDPTNATQLYRQLKGLYTTSGLPRIDPSTGLAARFVFAGDPTANPPTGWNDGLPGYYPGDRRLMLSSGPITMMPGDTQEILIAFVLGGGENRLASLTLLKEYSRLVQQVYKANFIEAGPPPLPIVTIGQLDHKIVLDWGGPQSSALTENSRIVNSGAEYLFQGYNIYQLPSPASTKSDAIRLATFDIIDGVTIILAPTYDPMSGLYLDLPKQYGSDNGIRHSLSISRDSLNHVQLINGRKYYYAVTAYNYCQNNVVFKNTYESPITILTAIPQGPMPGAAYPAENGKQIDVIHTGPSQGAVRIDIVDPTRIQARSYQVTFPDSSNPSVWTLTDTQSGTVLFSSSATQASWSGLNINVYGPTLKSVLRDWDQLPDGEMGVGWWSNESTNLQMSGGTSRFLSPQAIEEFGCQTYGPDIFGPVATGYPVYNSVSSLDGLAWFGATASNIKYLRRVEIRFGNYNGTTQTQKAYRFLRFANLPAAAPSFAPYILNTGTGFPFQDFRDVPFTVWDVDYGHGSPQGGRQLNVGFLENNEAGVGLFNAALGSVDGKWMPNNSESGAREWLFIYNTSYNSLAPPVSPDISVGDTKDIEYVFLPRHRTGNGLVNDVKLVIQPYITNSPADVFSFNTFSFAPTQSSAQAKIDVNQIQPYPNPCVGRWSSAGSNTSMPVVTFNHLPQRATIRIFTLSGLPVRTINKNSNTQFAQWDLLNFSGNAVASGIYLIYIDMPDLGVNKILKLGVL